MCCCSNRIRWSVQTVESHPYGDVAGPASTSLCASLVIDLTYTDFESSKFLTVFNQCYCKAVLDTAVMKHV